MDTNYEELAHEIASTWFDQDPKPQHLGLRRYPFDLWVNEHFPKAPPLARSRAYNLIRDEED